MRPLYECPTSAPFLLQNVGVSPVTRIRGFDAIGSFSGIAYSYRSGRTGVGLALFFGMTAMGPMVDVLSDPWQGRGWNAGPLAALGLIALGAGGAALRRFNRR